MSRLGSLIVYAYKEWQRPHKKQKHVESTLGRTLFGSLVDIPSYYSEPDYGQRLANTILFAENEAKREFNRLHPQLSVENRMAQIEEALRLSPRRGLDYEEFLAGR